MRRDSAAALVDRRRTLRLKREHIHLQRIHYPPTVHTYMLQNTRHCICTLRTSAHLALGRRAGTARRQLRGFFAGVCIAPPATASSRRARDDPAAGREAAVAAAGAAGAAGCAALKRRCTLAHVVGLPHASHALKRSMPRDASRNTLATSGDSFRPIADQEWKPPASVDCAEFQAIQAD